MSTQQPAAKDSYQQLLTAAQPQAGLPSSPLKRGAPADKTDQSASANQAGPCRPITSSSRKTTPQDTQKHILTTRAKHLVTTRRQHRSHQKLDVLPGHADSAGPHTSRAHSSHTTGASTHLAVCASRSVGDNRPAVAKAGKERPDNRPALNRPAQTTAQAIEGF